MASTPIDKDGKLNTDGPEAIAGAELYQKLVRDNGPAGVTGFNWYECQAHVHAGQGGDVDRHLLGRRGDRRSGEVQDRRRRRLRGHDRPARRCTVRRSSRAASASRPPAKKIGPAWYWVQWATGKAMQARQVAGGYGASGTLLAVRGSEEIDRGQVQPEWLDAVLKSTNIAYPVLPDIVAGNEFRDVFGVALTNMLSPGANPAAELKKATEQFKPILEKTEKA